MKTISYATARTTLALVMDRVCASDEPMKLARRQRPAVVVLSLRRFRAIEETLYLLSSPRSAIRLLDATADLQRDLRSDSA